MPDQRAPGDPPAVISDIDGTLIAFDGTPRRGDLAEMSFAFSVVRDRWNDDQSERELLEVRLYEVAEVPADA